MQILLVDDEADLRSTLTEYLTELGHEIRQAGSCAEALEVAKAWPPQVALLDQGLPDGMGLDLLPKLKELRPGCLVLMLTGFSSTKLAVQAMRLGAENYLEKPIDLEELKAQLEKLSEKLQLKGELGALRKLQLDRYQKEYLFLPDQHMVKVYEQVDQVADLERVNVLVQGETGTGKEHVARMIHFLSRRAAGPWVELHCGALPDTLLESELFGYEAGAFTDARKAKPGLFESAQGGTLFLDEIGEMPLQTQVKLLKVLEEKRVRRLGSTREIKLDVHIVAASNRDLAAEVEAGNFRRDLLFRLNAFVIRLPPLRERPNDIPALAQYFLQEASREFARPVAFIPKAAVAALRQHRWPGNVRELKNVVERLVISQVEAEPKWAQLNELLTESAGPPDLKKTDPDKKGQAELEMAATLKALAECQGNRGRAAEKLGISRKTLFNKLRLWERQGLLYSNPEYDLPNEPKTSTPKT